MSYRLLKFLRPKALRERCVHDFVDAINRMEYDSIADFMIADVVFADVRGDSLEGREAWVREHRRFRDAAGAPNVVIETLDHNRDEVLVRGYLDSPSPEINGPTMWRISFHRSRIAHIEVTRQYSQVTLPSFAARQERRLS